MALKTLTDSVRGKATTKEINHPNWTPEFVAGFQKYSGYDPRPYLPTLAGHLIGGPETTDRFLYDYRKTVGDLVAENYFGRLTDWPERRASSNRARPAASALPR